MATDETPATDGLAISGIELRDIGQTLMALGRQLQEVGRITEKPDDDAVLQEVFGSGYEDHSPEQYKAELEQHRATQDAMTQTLMGLQAFRRSYEHWERLTVEYALTNLNFTQRRAATLLGVAVSTVNRWAQHPLTDDEA